MKILVIQKKFLGDVLVCASVFKPLREKFPDAELCYLSSKPYLPVVQGNIYIDKFIFFDKLSLFRLISMVRREKFDIVIDTYGSLETALISFFSGAKSSSYYKKYTSFLYNFPIRRKLTAENPLLTTAIEHRLQLLEPFGVSCRFAKPEIFISPEEENQARRILAKFIKEGKKPLMISVFGSSAEKTYPLQYMAEVLEFIADHTDREVLCNYLPSQREDFLLLRDKLSDKAKARIPVDFDTENLREYIAVLSQCAALIGNEGGSTNISKALGIPTFSIFAPFVAKDSWNWLEDGTKNTSVHISDFAEADDYQSFKFDLFKNKLDDFLKENLK